LAAKKKPEKEMGGLQHVRDRSCSSNWLVLKKTRNNSSLLAEEWQGKNEKKGRQGSSSSYESRLSKKKVFHLFPIRKY
jgi:hypothetical protein